MWLPHKPGEYLVFLWRLVWLQPHQVVAQLSSENQTNYDPAVLKPPQGADVSAGAFSVKIMASWEWFSKNIGTYKKDQRDAFKLFDWKKDSSEYTVCWRSSKLLNIALKYWFVKNPQIQLFQLSWSMTLVDHIS